jgi:hypothetical protein
VETIYSRKVELPSPRRWLPSQASKRSTSGPASSQHPSLSSLVFEGDIVIRGRLCGTARAEFSATRCACPGHTDALFVCEFKEYDGDVGVCTMKMLSFGGTHCHGSRGAAVDVTCDQREGPLSLRRWRPSPASQRSTSGPSLYTQYSTDLAPPNLT